jgi:nucleolar protein 56
MANLGLAHAIARYNIKFDQRKTDKSIINSFSLLDMMDKNLNTFCMRIKEGYGWHFPELAKIVSNNEVYVRLVSFIGNKDTL